MQNFCKQTNVLHLGRKNLYIICTLTLCHGFGSFLVISSIMLIFYIKNKDIFFRPQLQAANLQPVQLTELEAEFSKVDGQKPVPSRYIRSQQVKQAKMAAEVAEDQGNTKHFWKYISNILVCRRRGG